MSEREGPDSVRAANARVLTSVSLGDSGDIARRTVFDASPAGEDLHPGASSYLGGPENNAELRRERAAAERALSRERVSLRDLPRKVAGAWRRMHRALARRPGSGTPYRTGSEGSSTQ